MVLRSFADHAAVWRAACRASTSRTVARECGGGVFRALAPPTTQRAVELDEVREPREPRLNELLLRGEEVALRREHGQVAVDAFAVAHVREVVAALLGVDAGALGLELLVEGRPRDERVGHLAERHLDRTLVLRDLDRLPDLGDVEA